MQTIPPERPAWKLSEVHEMAVAGHAVVHDIEGVEIAIHAWNTENGWCPPPWQMYGRLIAETAEYLAISQIHDGKRFFYTFLDKDFHFD